MQEEKDRNEALGEVVVQLNLELAEAKSTIEKLSEQHEKEIHDLKTLLSESLRREQMLRELNQESYSLLTMFGIDHIPRKVPEKEIVPIN